MNSNRRMAISAIGLGAATLAAPQVLKADKKFKWKMVTTWPKNFPGLGTGANNLARLIGELSNQRLQVKVYGAGELVPALQVFDAVSSGTAEMGHAAPYYWKGKHEGAQFFGAVPFGLNANEMNGWIKYGGGQKLWDEVYAGFGVKGFAAGNTGVQMGGWFNKEIKGVKDLKGLKMRMPGLGGEVLRSLGATVVNIPGGELFQALSQKTIDALEWVGPYNDRAFGFQKAAKLYYWPGWHEPCTNLEALVNKKSFESLPKDLQKVVEVACEAANSMMFAEFTARNSSSLEDLVNKDKVTIKKFPDDVLAALSKTSKEVIAETAKSSPLTKRIADSFVKFQKQVQPWTTISEEGYTLARYLTK